MTICLIIAYNVNQCYPNKHRVTWLSCVCSMTAFVKCVKMQMRQKNALKQGAPVHFDKIPMMRCTDELAMKTNLIKNEIEKKYSFILHKRNTSFIFHIIQAYYMLGTSSFTIHFLSCCICHGDFFISLKSFSLPVPFLNCLLLFLPRNYQPLHYKVLNLSIRRLPA